MFPAEAPEILQTIVSALCHGNDVIDFQLEVTSTQLARERIDPSAISISLNDDATNTRVQRTTHGHLCLALLRENVIGALLYRGILLR